MARWLFKTEPGEYSFDQLRKDKKTWWDGVSNPQARKFLRMVAKGDDVLIYHTGDERAIVGEAVVISGPTQDANEPENDKAVVVEIKAGKRWAVPVTLESIKAEPLFAPWELVRLPRLSVMPVEDHYWVRIREMTGD